MMLQDALDVTIAITRMYILNNAEYTFEIKALQRRKQIEA